jgi:MSHA biogenesis protein MshP
MIDCPNCSANRQQGFSLVMAIFILIVLALLGVYMARTSGVQHAIINDAFEGARVYQAAKAGLGWATTKLSTGGSCADVNAQTALTFPDIAGVNVALTCDSASYQEGINTISVYQLNARGQFGIFGDPDYVSRELEMSMVK